MTPLILVRMQALRYIYLLTNILGKIKVGFRSPKM